MEVLCKQEVSLSQATQADSLAFIVDGVEILRAVHFKVKDTNALAQFSSTLVPGICQSDCQLIQALEP